MDLGSFFFYSPLDFETFQVNNEYALSEEEEKFYV